ncbi:hypothetical protein CKALI_08995 [Corynebacterium kalinowskii]|uniref:TOMM leader peptide-binding protein n=1 Tax=Corynebacterium kalinowskii TaxID=2675216 RepID=A0A6B8VMK6_9CORY|nr:hypothetical protein [Corynebacterium kalinowskii]QGU02654.1 hypothetical protein CKALI_08995 [Corynebacterium kalinowskii]
MGDKLKLSDAARIVVRPGPAIQFGVDATTSGVIDSIAPQHIGPVVSALSACRTGIAEHALLLRLQESGLTEDASRALIAELTAYGILRTLPRQQPSIALVGRGPLAGAICELLRGSDCIVRRPLRGETDHKFIKDLQPEMPLVAVDRLAHARALGPAVRNGKREFFVPVQLIDGRGLIGPIATHSLGPCPLCLQLHRTDVDPHWPQVLTQIPGSSPSGAPVTVAATAAQTAAVVLSFFGLDVPALGNPGRSWLPGQVVQVDPFGQTQRFEVGRHDGCPLCFEAQYLEEGLPEISYLDWSDA